MWQLLADASLNNNTDMPRLRLTHLPAELSALQRLKYITICAHDVSAWLLAAMVAKRDCLVCVAGRITAS